MYIIKKELKESQPSTNVERFQMLYTYIHICTLRYIHISYSETGSVTCHDDQFDSQLY